MSSNTISPQIQTDALNQRFNEFKSLLCGEFRFALNNILCWSHLLRQGRLDKNSKYQAFEVIEHNAKYQNQLIDQLLNWHPTAEVSGQLGNIDGINQRFEEFKLALCIDIRFALNSILCWTYLFRLGRLDQSTIVQACEIIEHNAKQQNQLIDQLLNWHLVKESTET
jgi:signal transduction histidine kinase